MLTRFPPGMRRVLVSASAVGLLGTAVACGGPDPSTLRSGPIPDKPPRVNASDLPDEPGKHAPLTKKIEWKILDSTNGYARKADPDAKVHCPAVTGSTDAKIVCSVRYRGLTAKWNVSVNGGFLISYKMKPRARHVVRDVVEDEVRREADTKTVRCDMKPVQLIRSNDKHKIGCVWADDSDDGAMRLLPTSRFDPNGSSWFLKDKD